ncbi:class I adenylate-forming enzyme family protein [Bradyrhizobium genosp. P]|uniref:class I adenylate-forming enzyme family protein n=1 Tax=Bradyrhizobium genosp. P TaxID=83641 RepID=UPI003CED9BE9
MRDVPHVLSLGQVATGSLPASLAATTERSCLRERYQKLPVTKQGEGMLDRNRSISDVLRSTASAMPDQVAIVDEGGTMSYAEFDLAADRLATALSRSGIRAGDRVAYLFWNQRELLISYFAIVRLGATVVSLNCRQAAQELSYQLAAAECSAMILDSGLMTLADEAILDSGKELLRIVVGAPPSADWLSFDDAVRSGADVAQFETVDADAEGGIWFTSGTTGRPKGAVVRHRSAVSAAVLTALALSLTSDVRSLAVAPMFHRGAMENIALGVILVGGTQYLFKKLTPQRTLQLLERHRITMAFIVPTVGWQLLQEPSVESADLSHLTHWVSASAPLSVSLQRSLEERLRLRGKIVSWYGITETVFVSTCHPRLLGERPGSVGLPAPLTQVAVYDDARGMLPANEIGEIIVSGPTSFSYYLNNEKATQEALVEIEGTTWYRSGDLGMFDDDGYLTIKDRKKDMIISGGENIYSSEVETVLLSHPTVREGAIIGLPDDKWGEIVVAVVVEHEHISFDQDGVIKAFAQLASYKRPKRFLVLDALPRSSIGKVERENLRVIVREHFLGTDRKALTA